MANFWPNNITLREAGVNGLGAFISGLLGSVLVLLMTFWLSGVVNLTGYFTNTQIYDGANLVLPLMVSIIAFISWAITLFSTYYFLSSTSPNLYKKNLIHFKQIALFVLIIYIFITPIYFLASANGYENILYIFIGHMMLLSFGVNILFEILNNYRYVLVGIYGSLMALLLTTLFTILIFSAFSGGLAKLIVIILLFPFINGFLVLLKELFNVAYSSYYRYSGTDPIGDIFYQIEMEEEEMIREAEESNI